MEMMTVFQTTIPNETYAVLKSRGRHKEQLANDARRTLAMLYFQDRTLSLGQAADLAGLDRWEFIDFLGDHNVPVINLDTEEFEQEMVMVNKLAIQLKPDDK